MCSSSRKFKKLERSIKQTWAAKTHPDIKIIFYTDNQRNLIRKKSPHLKGNDLILPCKDGYLNCTEKTLQAFEYVSENYHFDYIFRTNLGSYVYLDRIIAFLADKPKTNFYSGIEGCFKKGDTIIKFASGSGYFLSKDLVDLIVLKKNSISRLIIDDVSLGEFMTGEGITIDSRAVRLSYTNDELVYQIGNKTVDQIDLKRVYHVRLRSDDRNIDIERMKILHHQKGDI